MRFVSLWARTVFGFLLVVLLVSAAASPVAAAAPFASLTVSPAGRQQYDISTGVTTMPDGGVITDLDTGVELLAKHIVYLAGAYIEAEGVEVSGEFGAVVADSLRVDLETGVLGASGGLSLVRDGLRITAGSLKYYSQRQVAVFDGGVTASGPAFEADRLLLDAVSGDVLLVGNYVFEDALFTMTSPEAGGHLELRFVLRDGLPVYDAATEVRQELLARFEGLL